MGLCEWNSEGVNGALVKTVDGVPAWENTAERVHVAEQIVTAGDNDLNVGMLAAMMREKYRILGRCPYHASWGYHAELLPGAVRIKDGQPVTNDAPPYTAKHIIDAHAVTEIDVHGRITAGGVMTVTITLGGVKGGAVRIKDGIYNDTELWESPTDHVLYRVDRALAEVRRLIAARLRDGG